MLDPAPLRNHTFFSLSELNQAIAKKLHELNNRPFKKLHTTRKKLCEAIDKPALSPLPPQPYEYADWKKARIMENRPHPEQGFRSALGIMRLANHHSPERVEKACTRALAIKAYAYKSIKSILKKGLVLDDLGLAPMSAQERRDMLEVIGDRHQLASTIVAAQLPIELWHENIRDPTIADAILDRLVHNAYKINLKGESLRKSCSSLTNRKESGK